MVGFASLTLALVACGQKGPLFLPKDAEAKGRATLPQSMTIDIGSRVEPVPAPTSSGSLQTYDPTDSPQSTPSPGSNEDPRR